MKEEIEKALKELGEEYVDHIGFLSNGAFVVSKREHDITPYLIRGFSEDRGFYEDGEVFYGCTDEKSAIMKFNSMFQ